MDEVRLAERLAAAEHSAKSAHKRLDELHELTNSIAGMVNELKHMREDVNRLSDELDDLRARPARRYDLAITTAVTAFVSGAAGYILRFFQLG